VLVLRATIMSFEMAQVRVATHWLLVQVKPLAHCDVAVQLVGQPAAPVHTYGLQLGEPAEPDGLTAHVPKEPLRLHALHEPLHALLQQYPSTHRLLVHWLAAVQVWPFGRFARHAPPLQ
jgi:hypothetical protein